MSLFKFEADFVASLRCIPMCVRWKLDICGIKLKLSHWNHFTTDERQQLVWLPCEQPEDIQAYREYLQSLVQHYTGAPAQDLSIDPTPWQSLDQVPAAVVIKAQAFQLELSVEQWRDLTPLQRFALIKLSRSSHENHNFYPALKEFHLI